MQSKPKKSFKKCFVPGTWLPLLALLLYLAIAVYSLLCIGRAQSDIRIIYMGDRP